jgi:anti-sigma B factor antagonist
MSTSIPKVEQVGNVRVITFTGTQTQDVENRIATELAGRTGGEDNCHLLLDFTNVEFLNSTELGTLVALHTTVKAAGGRLTLFNLAPRVYEVFTVTHLHRLLAICREQSSAPAAPVYQ